jgi:cytochrome c-type biogenesis protein CcmE
MSRKQKRAVLIAVALFGLALVVGIVLFGLSGSIVYFYSPSDVQAKHLDVGQRIRLGGLVEKGSLVRGGDGHVEFQVTDNAQSLKVRYQGVLPDLFREGQGVIAEGVLGSDGTVAADNILAKHDEKYMPPEVAKALKDRGVWRGDGSKGQPSATN